MMIYEPWICLFSKPWAFRVQNPSRPPLGDQGRWESRYATALYVLAI